MRGHIRKRGSKWAVIIPVGYDPLARKTRYKWYTYDTQAEAEKECARLINELNQGILIEPSKMKVADYMDYWLENYAEIRTRENTLQSYKTFITHHIKPEIGNILLNKLQPLHIQQMLTRKSKTGRADGKKGGLSSRSVKYIYSILNEALNHAVKWRLIPQNPASAVESPLQVKKPVQIWTPAETRSFLDAAKGNRFFTLFVMALSTGMRRGELLALKWHDVDFQTGIIQVNYTLSKQRTIKPAKTDKSQRQVVVTDNILEILSRHKARQSAERLKAGLKYQNDNLIFCSRLGTPLNAENIAKRYFYPLIEKAKVRKIRFHSLRHCSATMALAKDSSLKVISERLGHSTIKTTGDIYAHASIEAQLGVAQKIDEIMFEKEKNQP